MRPFAPIRHALHYRASIADIRSSSTFFVTSVPPHKVAARVTLRQWFARILCDAVVVASLGSSHSAVASFALAHGLSPNAIMEAAD